jgi:hypothetical protein
MIDAVLLAWIFGLLNHILSLDPAFCLLLWACGWMSLCLLWMPMSSCIYLHQHLHTLPNYGLQTPFYSSVFKPCCGRVRVHCCSAHSPDAQQSLADSDADGCETTSFPSSKGGRAPWPLLKPLPLSLPSLCAFAAQTRRCALVLLLDPSSINHDPFPTVYEPSPAVFLDRPTVPATNLNTDTSYYSTVLHLITNHLLLYTLEYLANCFFAKLKPWAGKL